MHYEHFKMAASGPTQYYLYKRLVQTLLDPEAEDQCYEILDEIGSGGFGAVNLVRNKTTDQRCAMKKLPCHPPDGPGKNEALRKEIETILNLKSDKNIIIIVRCFQSNK